MSKYKVNCAGYQTFVAADHFHYNASSRVLEFVVGEGGGEGEETVAVFQNPDFWVKLDDEE